MTLLADLEEFVHDHRPHGCLTGDVLHDGHGALADERDRHRMGTHAVAAVQHAAWEAIGQASDG